MTNGVDNDQRELGLQEHGELARQVDHSGVGRDQSIPRTLVMMEREEKLPVVHLAESRVDVFDGDEFSLADVARERVDNGQREVLIEGEEPSCCHGVLRDLGNDPARDG